MTDLLTPRDGREDCITWEPGMACISGEQVGNWHYPAAVTQMIEEAHKEEFDKHHCECLMLSDCLKDARECIESILSGQSLNPDNAQELLMQWGYALAPYDNLNEVAHQIEETPIEGRVQESIALRKDAERYRKLRDGQNWPAAFARHDSPEPLRGVDLDTACDGAE